MVLENSLDYARAQDAADQLASYRNEFHFPVIDGKEVLYFTGNSLGLQPKGARSAILQELDDWAQWGVEGHFHDKNPWYAYHEIFTEGAAKLVGARPKEVVMMNGLTVNLHLLLISFYKPEGKRFKIICEKKAFPSDQYALESQVRMRGFDPAEAIVEVGPRDGEHTLRDEDIISAIKKHGDELATIMIGGVNYYSGQLMNMKLITQVGHEVGAMVGFDLAHAAGNVPLELHDWGVDFACWCSYKYLNSGPGSVAGAYVHERHANRPELDRLAGWWGYDKEQRFKMEPGFQPMSGAEGWQLSNAPVLAMAVHKAALDMFTEVGMNRLREKSVALTNYLEFVIGKISSEVENCDFEVITPAETERRGSQLSILAHGQGRSLFDKLTKQGVIADWREPNVIRVAPVPMYNSFEDCYNFGQALKKSID
ncbi:MAG: kynureninase [Flavobacteriales bacterium]|nr:kynureninase [Flavobacteriales bacterium]